MKLTLLITLALLLAGCAVPAGISETVGDIQGAVESIEIDNTVVHGLPWWQWLIIGTFIPSIFEMISMLRRAITGGL